MKPTDFWWTEDQQVTVVNPTAETYQFKVHSKDYEVGSAKQAKMPGYIAWVYVYGLSTQLAQADNKFNRWNEEGFRKEYYEKLVTGVDEIMQDIEVKEEPSLVQPVLDEAEPSIEEGDELENESAPPTPKVQPMKAKAVGDKSPSRA